MGQTTLRPGDRVDRLIVLEEIGRGAKGVVFKAYDPRLDRNVALKIIQDGSGDDEDVARKRLVKEAQAMAKLSHPNVVTVHHVGTVRVDERIVVYLEMEYVRGRSLEAQMKAWREDPAWRRGAAWREVVALFAQAGAGLAAAHELGLVHRDFKPANVLVDDAARARVTDFGLVRRSGEALEDALEAKGRNEARPTPALDVPLTQTGAVVGTPAYMAPEQFDGRDGDALVDQFSFCVALYEALYGERPFPGDTVASLMHAVLEEAPRPPPAEAPPVPAFLHRVLRKGLSKDPAQRFADMPALLEALRSDPRVLRRRVIGGAGAVAGLGALGYGIARWLEPGVLALTVAGGGDALEGLEIEIDGRAIEPAMSVKEELAAGTHRLRVTADDHEPFERIFELARGETLPVHAPLEHDKGTIDLDVQPEGARLQIDGRDFGSVLEGLEVDTGAHRLQVSVPGAHETSLEFAVAKGEHLELTAYAEPAIVFQERGGGLPLGRGPLGDADGDGFGDVWNRDYGTLSAYSPVAGRVLWRRRISHHRDAAFLRMHDLDFDGAYDPILLGTDEQGAVLTVLRASDGEVRWRVVADEGREPLPLVPPVVVEPPGGPLVVATSLERGVVAAYDVVEKTERWRGAIQGVGFGLVAGQDPGGGWVAVAANGGVTVFDAATGDERFHHPVDAFDDALREAWLERDRLLLHGRDGSRSWLAATEVDGRPGADLVFPELTTLRGGPLRALSGIDGTVLWTGPRVDVWSFNTEDDHDGDGRAEVSGVRIEVEPADATPSIIVGGATGEVLVERVPGEKFVRWPCDGPLRSIRPNAEGVVVGPAPGSEASTPLGIADEVTLARCTDWDGDGTEDLVVATDHSGLRAFDDRGPLGAIALPRRIDFLEPLGDISGDARPDFLLGGGGIRVVLGSRVVWGRGFRAPLRTAPIVDDFDGDGALDVAIFDGQQEDSHLEVLAADDGRRLARAREGGFALRSPTPVPGLHEGTVDLVYLGSKSKVVRVLGHDYSTRILPIGVDKLVSYARIGAAEDGRRLWIASYEEAPHLRFVSARGDTWTPGSGSTRDDPWSLDFGMDGVFGGWTQPVALQLDDDTSLEVVASVDRARVVVVDADAGDCQWSRWAGRRLEWGPALLDLDGDARPEVLLPAAVDAPDAAPTCEAAAAAGRPGSAPDLLAVDGGSGSLRWRVPGAGNPTVPPVLAGTGDTTLVVGASPARGLYAVTREGELVWETAEVGRVEMPIRRADLDGDGADEVYVANNRGELVVVDSASGRVHWRWREPDRQELGAPVTLADIDGDQRPEIFIVSRGGTLFVLDGAFSRKRGDPPRPSAAAGRDVPRGAHTSQ